MRALPELYIATDVEAERSYWMGMRGCEWVETHKGTIKRALGLTKLPHTHHAGEDAAELAAVFAAMLERSDR